MFDDIEDTPELRELRALLGPELGDDADLAIEGLLRYMAIVLRIYESIENDPDKLERLQALTEGHSDPTIAGERSFTNQYEKP